MTNKELQQLVEKISVEYFARPFKHQALFNARLKSTGGRYHLDTHHLDFNPKVLEKLGQEVFEAIIKHELCHYHLHLQGLGYRHRDHAFKHLLKQVGGLRFVPQFMAQYHYQCVSCLQDIYRQRRLDVAKYVCRRCRGRLQFVTQKEG